MLGRLLYTEKYTIDGARQKIERNKRNAAPERRTRGAGHADGRITGSGILRAMADTRRRRAANDKSVVVLCGVQRRENMMSGSKGNSEGTA